MRLVAVLVILLFLAGCAVTRPQDLERVTNKQEIVLSEMISTVAYRGMHVRIEEGALPGTYTAERKDAGGTYYFGTDRSIWTTNEMVQKVPRLYVGGIFVPQDDGAPRFFYIFEKDVHTTENIDRYVQDRITLSTTVPGMAPSSGQVNIGANVVGNVLAGALIDSMLTAAVGSISFMPPIEDVTVRQKIYAGLRKAP